MRPGCLSRCMDNVTGIKVGLYFRRRQALCRASTRLSNAYESVSGVPVYTSHAGISARQRAPESVARRKMLQSSTVLNFRASRQQFSQSCTGVTNWVCSGSSLQLRQWARYWAISSSRRGRNALVVTVKEQSWPRGSNWVFHSCLPSPYI